MVRFAFYGSKKMVNKMMDKILDKMIDKMFDNGVVVMVTMAWAGPDCDRRV